MDLRLSDTLKDLVISGEERTALYNAVQGQSWRIQQDNPGSGGSYGPVYFGPGGAILTCETTLKDGRCRVDIIKAHVNKYLNNGKPTVTVKTMHHDNDDFWAPRAERYREEVSHRIIIVNGNYFSIGAEGGFGGRAFKICFYDLQVLTTRRLWYGGKIPPKWRGVLKDNAKFFDGYAPTAFIQ